MVALSDDGPDPHRGQEPLALAPVSVRVHVPAHGLFGKTFDQALPVLETERPRPQGIPPSAEVGPDGRGVQVVREDVDGGLERGPPSPGVQLLIDGAERVATGNERRAE